MAYITSSSVTTKTVLIQTLPSIAKSSADLSTVPPPRTALEPTMSIPPPPYSELDPNQFQPNRRNRLPPLPQDQNQTSPFAASHNVVQGSPQTTIPSQGVPNPYVQHATYSYVPAQSQTPQTCFNQQVQVNRPSRQVTSRDVREDDFELLREYDTIFIVDDSASMQVNEMPDGSIGPSRWEEARDALCGVVRIAARYDDDGIDVYFINDSRGLQRCRDPRQVERLFSEVIPRGVTPTGGRLELLLLDYLDAIEYAARKNKKYGPGTVKTPKRRNVSCLLTTVRCYYRWRCNR